MVDAVGTVIGSSSALGSGDGIAPQPGGQSVGESLSAGSSMEAVLKAGLRVLSLNQNITFTLYKKVVLPLDGFIFWVKAELLSDSALVNNFLFNSVPFNKPRRVIGAAKSFNAMGSLHVTSTLRQRKEESLSVNRVVFTSEVIINDLNQTEPDAVYMATVDGNKYAFSSRESFYRQANLYHYVGEAIYPSFRSQIIDDLAGFDSRNVVVSNSLPIWLSLNKFMPMYPSFLVDSNIPPPFCSVDIFPESTVALQMAPRIDRESNHWQLVTERVKLVMYGLRNFQALDFQDYILDQSLAYNTFGIMNSPVVRDEKQTQLEVNILAMKKSMELEVNYYQVTVRNLARQMILEAIPTLYIGGGVSAVVIP